jgi:hypothetical protein
MTNKTADSDGSEQKAPPHSDDRASNGMRRSKGIVHAISGHHTANSATSVSDSSQLHGTRNIALSAAINLDA